MHAVHQLKLDNNKNFPMSSFCMILAEGLWEGASGSQHKIVQVNIGSKGRFTKTVLVGGTDGLLATNPIITV